MKAVTLTCLFLWLFFAITPVFAENTPTPTEKPEQKNIFNFVNTFESKRDPDFVIQALNTMFKGLDSMFGGFMFNTPDVFGDKITIKNGEKNVDIDGLTNFRNLFYEIAIPIIAIVIAVMSIGAIGSESKFELKRLFYRILIVVALLLIVPSTLSLSINTITLLDDQIIKTASVNVSSGYLNFIYDYFEKAKTQTDVSQKALEAGIPDLTLSLAGGLLNPTQFIVNIFVFVVCFLFLIASFIYIAFQSVYRFATLVFLSVLFPIVIPFYLSERTEGIVYTYFKLWFTALIWQPAFVLGFMIASKIFTSMIHNLTPNIGLLFFFAGFMFFLGNVNTIVSRIFADVISNVNASIQSGAAASAISGLSFGTMSEVKRGMFGGGVHGARSFLGRKLGANLGTLPSSKGFTKGFDRDSLNAKVVQKGKEMNGVGRGGNSSMPGWKKNLPTFSEELNKKGFTSKVVDKGQGIVSVSGNGFSYKDPSTGMNSIYSSKEDAVKDGVDEAQLSSVSLKNNKFIDLSQFKDDKSNPHNAYATQQAQKANGGKIPQEHNPHLTPAADSNRVKNFMKYSRDRNKEMGVQGVVVKRWGNNNGQRTKDKVLRFYSDDTV